MSAEALNQAAAFSSGTNLSSLRVGQSTLDAPAAGTASSSQPALGGGVVLPDGVPDEVGASGEYFVFLDLSRRLPNFVRACWVSALKLRYLCDASADSIENDLGADFRYHDRDGKLTGSGRSETVYIEVKSLTHDAVQPFRLSANEWSLAKRCHESAFSEVYILAVVTSVTHSPALASLIIDPVQRVESGAATVDISELVYSPKAIAANGISSGHHGIILEGLD